MSFYTLSYWNCSGHSGTFLMVQLKKKKIKLWRDTSQHSINSRLRRGRSIFHAEIRANYQSCHSFSPAVTFQSQELDQGAAKNIDWRVDTQRCWWRMTSSNLQTRLKISANIELQMFKYICKRLSHSISL